MNRVTPTIGEIKCCMIKLIAMRLAEVFMTFVFVVTLFLPFSL